MSFNFVIPEINIGGNGTEVPTLQFYKRGFNLGGSVSPTWQDIILHGTTALTLVNAKAGSLEYLKLFGGTDQLPSTYLDTVTLSGGCEQRNLPSGYTQVEYLEVATINAYFSTGINATIDTDIGITASNVTSNSSQLLVAECGSGGDYFRIAKAGASQRVIGTLGPSTVTDNNTDGVTKFTARVNKSGFYVDGSLIGTFSDIPSSLTDVGEIDIFRGVYSTSASSAIYYAYLGTRFHRAWVDDNIFLPCRRNSDNQLGIYNTKTGQFILPSGEGTFIAGADVVVPSPTNPIDIVCNNGAIKVSKNLFNYSVFYDNYQMYGTSNIGRCPIKLQPNTPYTISTNTQLSNVNSSVFVVSGSDIEWTGSSSTNGVFVERPKTVTADSNGYICLGIYTTGTNAIPESDFENGTVWIQVEQGSTATSYMPYGQIYTNGTQEVVTDGNGNTATAERLLAVGTYKDTQEVIAGSVTRRVGIKVLDGTEEWVASSTADLYSLDGLDGYDSGVYQNGVVLCTHFVGVLPTVSGTNMPNYSLRAGGASTSSEAVRRTIYIKYVGLSSLTDFKQFLAQQYANGIPVIVVYPTSSATTESVSGQFLSKSPVTQTAGSISNLPIAITESQKTVPTPQQPLQINCNNGVVKVSKNLFNANVVLRGTIATTGMDGNPNPARARLEYLYLPAGTYTLSNNGNTINQAIGASYSDNTGSNFSPVDVWAWHDLPFTFALTSNRYVRFMVRNSSDVELTTENIGKFQIEAGSTATPYMPYGAIYVDGTTETVEITGNNLFNPTTKIEGYYIDANGGLVESANFSYSALIPVVEGSAYTWSGTSTRTTSTGKRIHGYNSNGEWVQQIDYIVTGGGNYSLSVTIPSGVAYIRISGIRINESPDTNVQVEQGSSATTYEQYFNGGTATAEMLLKVGTYQDEQSVLDGGVTRNVGIKVLNGTENWIKSPTAGFYIDGIIPNVKGTADYIPYCSHYTGVENSNTNYPGTNKIKLGYFAPSTGLFKQRTNLFDSRRYRLTVEQFKQWLSDQYNAGTPVIIVYPLATATTETVTAQPMNIQAGSNTVSIVQASMDDLELEVKYKATA